MLSLFLHMPVLWAMKKHALAKWAVQEHPVADPIRMEALLSDCDGNLDFPLFVAPLSQDVSTESDSVFTESNGVGASLSTQFSCTKGNRS